MTIHTRSKIAVSIHDQKYRDMGVIVNVAMYALCYHRQSKRKKKIDPLALSFLLMRVRIFVVTLLTDQAKKLALV
jgi:hypothetical protein